MPYPDTVRRCQVPTSFATERVSVRIDDINGNRELAHVGLALTEAEARELRDTIETLLTDPGERHEHVSSADYQTEITLWITRGE